MFVILNYQHVNNLRGLGRFLNLHKSSTAQSKWHRSSSPSHMIQRLSCKIFELVKSVVVLLAWKVSILVVAPLLHMNIDKGF